MSDSKVCPQCGRSYATHLTAQEALERFGYSRSRCLECTLTDQPRPQRVNVGGTPDVPPIVASEANGGLKPLPPVCPNCGRSRVDYYSAAEFRAMVECPLESCPHCRTSSIRRARPDGR